jgi:hypothetical protein
MSIQHVFWDTDDEPDGNVQHIAEHGLTKQDIEEVLYGVHELDTSRSSGRPIALGFNSAGQYLCVVFDWVDDDTVYPVTAYLLDE